MAEWKQCAVAVAISNQRHVVKEPLEDGIIKENEWKQSLYHTYRVVRQVWSPKKIFESREGWSENFTRCLYEVQSLEVVKYSSKSRRSALQRHSCKTGGDTQLKIIAFTNHKDPVAIRSGLTHSLTCAAKICQHGLWHGIIIHDILYIFFIVTDKILVNLLAKWCEHGNGMWARGDRGHSSGTGTGQEYFCGNGTGQE